VPSIALDNFALGTTEPAIGTLEGCAWRCPSATAGESLQPLAHWGCRLSGFWLNVGNADVSGRRGGQNREPVARRRLRYHSIRIRGNWNRPRHGSRRSGWTPGSEGGLPLGQSPHDQSLPPVNAEPFRTAAGPFLQSIHPRNAGTSDGERGRRMTTIVVSGSTTSRLDSHTERHVICGIGRRYAGCRQRRHRLGSRNHQSRRNGTYQFRRAGTEYVDRRRLGLWRWVTVHFLRRYRQLSCSSGRF
jgi:hypothetical protein